MYLTMLHQSLAVCCQELDKQRTAGHSLDTYVYKCGEWIKVKLVQMVEIQTDTLAYYMQLVYWLNMSRDLKSGTTI